ncbi:MAG: DUF6512 family protein [Bacilli bacterium]|jgi:hypothetical protein
MEEMNRLRNYELVGIPVILMIATVFASIFSNLGNGTIWQQLIVVDNISLFQIAQYMFMGILLYSAFEYAVLADEYPNFVFAKAACAIAGPFIFLFLTYFFNSTFSYTDNSLYVATFLVGVSVGQLLSYYFLREGYYFRLMNAYGALAFLLLLMVFYVYANNRIFFSPIFEPLTTYENIVNPPYYTR